MNTIHLESLSHLSCSLRESVGSVRRATEKLKIRPSTLNGVPYYSADDAEKIASYLRSRRESK